LFVVTLALLVSPFVREDLLIASEFYVFCSTHKNDFLFVYQWYTNGTQINEAKAKYGTVPCLALASLIS